MQVLPISQMKVLRARLCQLLWRLVPLITRCNVSSQWFKTSRRNYVQAHEFSESSSVQSDAGLVSSQSNGKQLVSSQSAITNNLTVEGGGKSDAVSSIVKPIDELVVHNMEVDGFGRKRAAPQESVPPAKRTRLARASKAKSLKK